LIYKTIAMSEAGNKRRERKHRYKARLLEYLGTYKNVLVVEVDNVGSNQMQKVRIALRGKAVLLMGKNTLMRKVIREQAVDHAEMEALLQLIYGNIGFVFTNANLNEIRKAVLENKVPAAAKQGSLAPADVYVPAGPTGLDPGQTSFFQALNIATKIVKGTIEIVNLTHLIKPGDKITSSHVALLTKLNILPFFYGFKVTQVYEEGTVYASSVLDMQQDDILNKFKSAVSKFSAISLAAGYPTAPPPSAPSLPARSRRSSHCPSKPTSTLNKPNRSRIIWRTRMHSSRQRQRQRRQPIPEPLRPRRQKKRQRRSRKSQKTIWDSLCSTNAASCSRVESSSDRSLLYSL